MGIHKNVLQKFILQLSTIKQDVILGPLDVAHPIRLDGAN